MNLPGKTIPNLTAVTSDNVTDDGLFVFYPELGPASKLPASELVAALNAARVGETTLGRWAQYWDNQSHKLNSLFGSDAAVYAQFPHLAGITLDRTKDEIVWASLQNAIDEAEAAAAQSLGRLPVIMPPGVGWVNRPIRIRENTVLIGAGMRNTTIHATHKYGCVLMALSRNALDSDLIDGANGLIIGGTLKPVVDFSELQEFGNPPASADWYCEVEFRYDSGEGYMFGAGGRLTRAQDRYMYCNLLIDGSQQFRAFGQWTDSFPGPASGAVGSPVVSGNWYTARITLTSSNTAKLTVNAVDTAFNNPTPYPNFKWYDSLVIGQGGYSPGGLWPDNKYDSGTSQTLAGRIRNVKFPDAFGGTVVVPFTNVYAAHTTATSPADARIFIRPTVDLTGMDSIHLQGFRVQGGGSNTNIYINNSQNSTLERVDSFQGYYGAQFHKNCYSLDVAGCRFSGANTPFMAWGNAQQFAAVNCTMQGGFCPTAVYLSYGAQFVGCWFTGIFNLSAGAGTGMVVSTSQVVFSGQTINDEGSSSGIDSLGVWRDSKVTVSGSNISRSVVSAGTVIKIDGGGSYTIVGGRVRGFDNNSTPVFSVVTAPTYKIMIVGVDKQTTVGTTSPPWCSAADAKYFDLHDAQPFPVSVANDGTLATGIPAGAGKCFEIQVVDGTNTRSARYGVDNTTFTAVYAHSQFTTTQDTPAKVNTYVSSGFVVVQNKSGGPLLLAAYEK